MSDQTIAVLHDLIQLNHDGRRDFNAAADAVQGSEIRHLLLEGLGRCRDAASELEVLMRHLGAEPPTDGTVGGALQRGWREVKSVVAPHSDITILEDCERAESAACDAYRDALDEDVLFDVRIVIERQYQAALSNHGKLRLLLDSLTLPMLG